MPLHIPLKTDAYLTISDARLTAMKSTSIAEVDFSNAAEVKYARDKIRNMGIIDAFVDWAFYHNSKAEFLDLIAEKIICDQAAHWEFFMTRNPAYRNSHPARARPMTGSLSC